MSQLKLVVLMKQNKKWYYRTFERKSVKSCNTETSRSNETTVQPNENWYHGNPIETQTYVSESSFLNLTKKNVLLFVCNQCLNGIPILFVNLIFFAYTDNVFSVWELYLWIMSGPATNSAHGKRRGQWLQWM